jgi:molybdenum cofactor cytidylyltransferase
MAIASARNLAALCRRTIVVIRPEDSLLGSLLAAEGFATVACAKADQGMGASLSCGIAASADADGWLVALADMPFIQAASYRCVLQALRDGALMARPIHEGQMGHPVGFAASSRTALQALGGDTGGRGIIDADPAALVACPVDDPGVRMDIDRPQQSAP